MPKTPLNKIIEGDSEKPCNHFMVWNIQGGYAYYRCDKCNYIDGEKTFKNALEIHLEKEHKKWTKQEDKIRVEILKNGYKTKYA